MAIDQHTVSRRSFVLGVGVAAAGAATAAPLVQTAMPWGSERVGSPLPQAPTDAVRAWYEATVDRIVREWEPRFRFRQYQRDGGDIADWIEPPQFALEFALEATALRDPSAAFLVLAASRQDADGLDDAAPVVMAKDALDHAERLGYFATDPGALRFPVLRIAGDYRDDIKAAEAEVEAAEHMERLAGGRLREVAVGLPDEWYAEQDTRAERARVHLAALRAGEIPALTAREKLARYFAERRAALAAYKARLDAAGVDSSWVDMDHPCLGTKRLAELDEDEGEAVA